MAKVVMHKASDGSLHDSKKSCDKHDFSIRVYQNADEADFDETSFSRDDENNPVVYRKDLAGFIALNADKLLAILNDSLVAKRKRKAKPQLKEAA